MYDKPCLYIGLTFLGIYISIGLASLFMGDRSKISIPADQQGNLCLNSYIYFVNPDDISRTVCVKQCPQEKQELQCVGIPCKENISPTDPSKRILVYNSTLYNNMACLPNNYNEFEKVAPGLLPSSSQLLAKNMKLQYGSLFFTLTFTVTAGLILYWGVYYFSRTLIYGLGLAIPISFVSILFAYANKLWIDYDVQHMYFIRIQFFFFKQKRKILGAVKDINPSNMNLYLEYQINKTYFLMFISLSLLFGLFAYAYLMIQKKYVNLMVLNLESTVLMLSHNRYNIEIMLAFASAQFINFFLYYNSVLSFLAFGSTVPNQLPLQSFQVSIVGVILIIIQSIFALYFALFICSTGEYLIIDIFGHQFINNQQHKNFINYAEILQDREPIKERGRALWEILGSIFYLSLLLLINLPLYLITLIPTRNLQILKLKRFVTFIKTSTLIDVSRSQLGTFREAHSNLGQELLVLQQSAQSAQSEEDLQNFNLFLTKEFSHSIGLKLIALFTISIGVIVVVLQIIFFKGTAGVLTLQFIFSIFLLYQFISVLAKGSEYQQKVQKTNVIFNYSKTLFDQFAKRDGEYFSIAQ